MVGGAAQMLVPGPKEVAKHPCPTEHSHLAPRTPVAAPRAGRLPELPLVGCAVQRRFLCGSQTRWML